MISNIKVLSAVIIVASKYEYFVSIGTKNIVWHNSILEKISLFLNGYVICI